MSLSANLSYENEFCMQFNFHANQSHFHKNGFALRLALKRSTRELGNGGLLRFPGILSYVKLKGKFANLFTDLGQQMYLVHFGVSFKFSSVYVSFNSIGEANFMALLFALLT